MAAGSAKAQGFVSMANGSTNQRASCAATPPLLRVSLKTAHENGSHHPSASNNNGGIFVTIFDSLRYEAYARGG